MKKEQEILDLVEDYIARDIFPGANFAVIEKSEVKEFLLGNAAIFPEKVPLVSGMLWDLASVTKVVGTGTAVIDLVLTGHLDLELPLQHYLKDFADASVTLRQLLTHTSGIDPFIARRDELSAVELRDAMYHLKVTEDKNFHYTDVNFILLGFLLEHFYGENLDEIFAKAVFAKWQMESTGFGPVKNAVPTAQTVPTGTVHDPKARVLGVHCGSAGLFSSLTDLSNFVQGYFADEKYLRLLKNYAVGAKKRSIAWDFAFNDENWLLHTGYTGTFILMNLSAHKAVVFLSNRVHLKDERAKWILERDKLIRLLIKNLTD